MASENQEFIGVIELVTPPLGPSINGINDVGTLDLENLCINNINIKLRNPGQYDIGGCHQESLDLWFFYTTTICPGDNYLLNIFVSNIKPSFVSLEITSKSNLVADENGCKLSGEFEKIIIIKNEGNYHLRTYRFSEENITFMESNRSMLLIPLKVTSCSENSEMDVHPSVRNKVKSEHNLWSLLSKNCKYDFALVSKKGGKKHNVHKIVLNAHSAVLKDLLKSSTEDFIILDLDDMYLEVLIEFLYNGCLNLKKEDQHVLIDMLDIANQFQIHTLTSYIQVLLNAVCLTNMSKQ